MAILRMKDIRKMKEKEIEEKLKELKFELTKGSVTANKAKAKTKEIKRAIARLLTFSKSSKNDYGEKNMRKEALKK